MLKTLIMAREDVGEIEVNAVDVETWQGYGFAIPTAPEPEPAPEPKPKAKNA